MALTRQANRHFANCIIRLLSEAEQRARIQAASLMFEPERRLFTLGAATGYASLAATIADSSDEELAQTFERMGL